MSTPTRTRIAVDAAREGSRQLTGGRRDVKGQIFLSAILLSIVVAVVTLGLLLITTAYRGWDRLDLNLVTQFPSTLFPETAGLKSAIVGTLMIMGGVIVTVIPIGVSAAIYLEEYADDARWYNRAIEVNIQNLAAVPSIVFGILGLAFVVQGGFALGAVAFAGSLTLAMLVLPTVVLASREAIRAVPDSIRQASYGLGATQWATIRRQVMPAALPGVLTGTILALSRAIGETAPLLLVGATTFAAFYPESPFEGKYSAMPVLIYQWAARPQDEFRVLAAAGIMLLLVILLMMNSIAIWLRNKYTPKY